MYGWLFFPAPLFRLRIISLFIHRRLLFSIFFPPLHTVMYSSVLSCSPSRSSILVDSLNLAFFLKFLMNLKNFIFMLAFFNKKIK